MVFHRNKFSPRLFLHHKRQALHDRYVSGVGSQIAFEFIAFLGSALLYGSGLIWFKADETHRPMPLILGLALVALFIWFAENLATYARAWSYPNQQDGWHIVSVAKLGSWYLLMLISFVLVSWMHQPITNFVRKS